MISQIMPEIVEQKTGYRFTVEFGDSARVNIPYLCTLKKPETVIEIGVYEGNTTFNMTEMFAGMCPTYRHYAIDPFDESADLTHGEIPRAFENFTANLVACPFRSHIEFMRATSSQALSDLYAKDVRADLIYVDGDHRAMSVLEDLVLSWRLLRVGGVLLCDDATVWGKGFRLQDTPRLAVDTFIQCNWDRLEVLVLPSPYQVAIRRMA